MARIGTCFSGQALRRSLVIAPTPLQCSHFVLVPLVPPSHGSGPSWSLPPGPGSGCNASCTCRANLPCARSCSSRNSILARFLALNQTFVSLSLPPSLSVCLLSLCVQSLPPFSPCCGAYTHLYHVHSLSTNWHLLGSDRDTKTKLGTNPSKPNYLVQTSWSQDRRSRTACLPSHPGPSRSFFLFVSWKRAPRVSLALHRVYFFSTVTPEITKLSLTRTYSAVALHTSPVPSLLDTRCDVQPATFTLDHTPA